MKESILTNRQESENIFCGGFSLLELLIVVSILVSVAGIATFSLSGLADQSDEKLVHTEMLEIHKAILQFRDDTGYLPGKGPFALDATVANCTASMTGSGAPGVRRDSLMPSPPLAMADHDEWFSSPANLWQLFTQPQLCNAHPLSHLEKWVPETGRGWRGPYINGFSEGYVEIGTDISPLNTGAGGDPLILVGGVGSVIVPGLADPFREDAESVGGKTLFDWTLTYDTNGDIKNGRPYLFFHDLTGLPVVKQCQNNGPALIGFGPDGKYNQGGGDDLVLCI